MKTSKILIYDSKYNQPKTLKSEKNNILRFVFSGLFYKILPKLLIYFVIFSMLLIFKRSFWILFS